MTIGAAILDGVGPAELGTGRGDPSRDGPGRPRPGRRDPGRRDNRGAGHDPVALNPDEPLASTTLPSRQADPGPHSLTGSGPSGTSMRTRPSSTTTGIADERQLGGRVERVAGVQVEPRQVQRAGQRAGGQEALVELEVLVAADALEGPDLAVDVDTRTWSVPSTQAIFIVPGGTSSTPSEVDPAGHAAGGDRAAGVRGRLRRRPAGAGGPLRLEQRAQPVLGLGQRHARRRPARGSRGR